MQGEVQGEVQREVQGEVQGEVQRGTASLAGRQHTATMSPSSRCFSAFMCPAMSVLARSSRCLM